VKAVRHGLTGAEREFLERVSAAAFSNPFSEGRAVADRALSGLPAGTDADARLEAALGNVRAFLTRLETEGRASLARVRGEDRDRLTYAHLFDLFHRHVAAFDALIGEQLGREAPVPAPFVGEVLASLAQRGFTREEALGFAAMFYQLRRAYYFIDRSLVGRSASMRALRRALWDNVFTADLRLYARHLSASMEDFSTLLLGETGTGKGAAAAAIGRSGLIPYDARRGAFAASFTATFIAINLSQFPEALVESELFGHRKGAFTGAVEAHDGVFARCSPYGAIFLDEIGEVAVPLQIKLLQVLQERTFTPVGSHERRRFSGRVIAASNRPIDDLRRRGTFRDDFFYRLCSDVIRVPPLRQRIAEDPGELEDLVRLTVRRIAGGAPPTAGGAGDPAAAGALADIVLAAVRRQPGANYAWPGNVRELEQCVRRILVRGAYEGESRAGAPDLQAALVAGIERGELSAEELLAGYCRLLHGRFGTYEEVARRTGLDRRTAKKYIFRDTKGQTRHEAFSR
jgi:DNA-binding NtrC family response regulator